MAVVRVRGDATGRDAIYSVRTQIRHNFVYATSDKCYERTPYNTNREVDRITGKRKGARDLERMHCSISRLPSTTMSVFQSCCHATESGLSSAEAQNKQRKPALQCIHSDRKWEKWSKSKLENVDQDTAPPQIGRSCKIMIVICRVAYRIRRIERCAND